TTNKILSALQDIVLKTAKATMPASLYTDFEARAKPFFTTQKENMYTRDHLTRSLLIMLSIISAQIVRIYATDPKLGAKIVKQVETQFKNIKDTFGKIIPELKGGSLIDGAIRNLQNIGAQTN